MAMANAAKQVVTTFERGSTGKRLVTRSIPDWCSYWYSACYSVLESQAGCNGRVILSSPPFFSIYIRPPKAYLLQIGLYIDQNYLQTWKSLTRPPFTSMAC